MSSIRNNILKYTGKKGLTIFEFAELCDLSQDTIHYILYKNAKDCKATTLVKLAKTMEITIDELVGNK